MKKILVLFAATVALITSCKCPECPQCPDAPNDTAATATEANCQNLDEYYHQPDLTAKVNWLRANGNTVCEDTLYKYIERAHMVKNPSSFAGWLRQYWGNATTTYTPVTWKDLNKMTQSHLYDKYVTFVIKTDNTVSPELTDNYSTTRTCYSVPLFRSIAKKLHLQPDDVSTPFEFARAGTNGNEIMFRIKGSRYFEYNFSNDPQLYREYVPL